MAEHGQPTKRMLLVADYGHEDLAFKEVQGRLYDLAKDAGQKIQVDIVSVGPFHTADTAAVVAQAAQDGKYDIIYHNTAPRKDAAKARANNDGEGIGYARYRATNGKEVDIVGVISGDAETVNTFALLNRSRLVGDMHAVKSAKEGSQFRSRDVFPPHVIAALTNTIQLDSKPLEVDAPINQDKVGAARLRAVSLLANAYDNQLSRHGDASQAYVTVVGAGGKALAQNVAQHAAGAEVDLLPLKSTRNQWVEGGFAAAQLALNSGHAAQRTLVILPDSKDTLDTAATLYEAKLDNGAAVLTSNLSALAFVRERIAGDVRAFGKDGRKAELKDGRIAVEGTAQLVARDELDRATKLPAEITPAYTDGYGNVKLAVLHKTLDHAGPGERKIFTVKVGDKEVDAIIASGSFAVRDGDVALSSGSSGWAADNHPGSPKQYFAEVFKRGGNASEALGVPQPGDAFSITLKAVERNVPPGPAVSGEGREAEIREQRVKGA